MSELIALTRVAVAHHRGVVLILLSVLLLGELGAGLVWLLDLASLGPAGAALILLATQLPVALSATVLFDYGQQRDLMSRRSGCSEWLLLQPIASWKIAAVPILLKSAWFGGICLLCSLTVSRLGIDLVAVPGLPLFLAGCGSMLWLLAIGWRPLRHGWNRLLALGLCLPLLYAAVVLSIVVSQPTSHRYWGLSALISSFVFVSGAAMVFDGVRLAKSHWLGAIPERGGTRERGHRSSVNREAMRGRVATLIWHDLARTGGQIRVTAILGVIPAVLISVLFVPLHAGVVGMLMLLMVYLGALACGGLGGQRNCDLALPPYLASMPVRTATIAWARLATVLLILFGYVACLSLVFLGWSIWESNRAIWYGWANDMAVSLGTPEAAVSVGLRWSAVIVLASSVFMCGRLIAYLWVGMVGRTWVQLLVTGALSLGVLTLLGTVIGWFLQQTDWESTAASAKSLLQYVPALVGGLLMLKVFLAITAVVLLIRWRLASPREVALAGAIWAMLTLVLAAMLAGLVPDPSIGFVWCLAAVALAVPLGRALILPVSLSWNRHR